jgi:hypothetical protein
MKKILIALLLILVVSTPAFATNWCSSAVGCFLMEGSTTETDEAQGNTLSVSTDDTIEQSGDHKFGSYSRSFVASDLDYLYHADGLDTDINGAEAALSIVLWIKTTDSSISDDLEIVSKYNATGNQRQYKLNIDDSDGEVLKAWISADGTNTTAAYGTTDIADNAWHHIAVVYNGSNITLYVDGSVDTNGANNPASYSSGIYNGSAQFRIGVRDGLSNVAFNGLVDDVGIFDTALSQANVQDIMNNGLIQSASTQRIILIQ